MSRVPRIFPFLFLLIFLVGCAAGELTSESFYADEADFLIDEEARIADTAETREVLEVLIEYRRALVSKDFGAISRMVSEDYYDNAGTTHTTGDDWGQDQLGEVLELLAQHAEQIRYRVIVKDVQVENRRAQIDFEYEYAFQYKVGDLDRWDAGTDVMRMQLAREGDRWRITGGL